MVIDNNQYNTLNTYSPNEFNLFVVHSSLYTIDHVPQRGLEDWYQRYYGMFNHIK